MGFSFRTADAIQDRDIILKLWKENIQVDDVHERYQWLYFENPAGPMRTVLAVHDETGEIVGAGSLYPQKVRLFGHSVIFGTAADYMVDRRFRVFGPAVQIQRKLLESATDFGFDYLLGFPNKAAMGVIKRIGYQQIGFAHRYVKLLKTHNLLVAKIRLPVFPAIVAFLIDSFLSIEDYLKSVFFKVKYKHVVYDNVKSLKLDSVFLSNNNSLVILDKSSEKLTWRYNQDHFRFFSISTKNSNHSYSFIVYTVNAGVASIIDIIFQDDNSLEPLLKLFVLEMHKVDHRRIDIQFLGDRRTIDLLRKLRFYLRENDRACYVFINKHIPDEFKVKILDESNWFVFESDMDI